MLTRYGNIDFVLNMSWRDGFNLYLKAIEKEQEEKVWEMWLSIYPKMDKNTFVSFKDFYNNCRSNNNSDSSKRKSKKSNEEIKKEGLRIINLHKGLSKTKERR